MQLLKTYQSKLNALKKQIPQFAKEAIIANGQIIVNYVKYGQLAIGENSFGMPLAFSDFGNSGTGFYAASTQAIATREGARKPKPAGGAYNFEWTGETFDNMKLGGVNKSKGTYNIITAAGKQALLESLYGEIFELTPENNEKVNREIIEPYVAQKIEENIAQFL